jgi:hypothetical protein
MVQILGAAEMRSMLFALMSIALCGTTRAETIVYVESLHNLDYAAVACKKTIEDAADLGSGGPLADWMQTVFDGAAECKSASDPRVLGRKLEDSLLDALATDANCEGTTFIREPHPDFDHTSLAPNDDVKGLQPYWGLQLDYEPGNTEFGWSMAPYDKDDRMGYLVTGEGDSQEAADAICLVAKRRGATIR